MSPFLMAHSNCPSSSRRASPILNRLAILIDTVLVPATKFLHVCSLVSSVPCSLPNLKRVDDRVRHTYTTKQTHTKHLTPPNVPRSIGQINIRPVYDLVILIAEQVRQSALQLDPHLPDEPSDSFLAPPRDILYARGLVVSAVQCAQVLDVLYPESGLSEVG